MPALILFQAASTRLIRLSAIDTAIITIYFVAVLAIGFYLKEQAHTGKDFFLNCSEKGNKFKSDQTLASVAPDDFDALLLPGGVANPDRLRTIPDVVTFVSSFN